MKKAMLALMLLLGALAFAQDSDDFFSDSNDSALDAARQKNEQRQDANAATSADKQCAKDLVQGTDAAADDQAAVTDEEGTTDDDQATASADDQDAVAQADADSTDNADSDIPDRYKVKREMIINLFGIELTLTFTKDKQGRQAVHGSARADRADDRKARKNALAEDRKARKNALAAEAAQADEAAQTDEAANADDDQAAATEKKEAPFSPFVFSVLPGISVPFGTYRTNLSLAAIGGITAGVEGIAASGVFDIDSGDLLGVQTAGIFSVVDGDALAVQGSGIFSIVSGDMKGLQLAGIFNVTGKDLMGVQGAGIFNMARDVTGVQAAGIFNTARQVKGVQAAGIFNVANDVTGVQAAGIVNVAATVKGTQIGLINISKDMYGIPIGLFSFTLNGIRDVGAWQDSSDTIYSYWANGTNNFYTIMYAGESRKDWFVGTDSMAVGVGLGARLIEKSLQLDIDLSAKSYYGPRFAQQLTALRTALSTGVPPVGCVPSPVFPSLRLSLGLPIYKRFAIFAGASADIGIAGVCEVPEEIRSAHSVSFPAFGTRIDLSPQLYWGLHF